MPYIELWMDTSLPSSPPMKGAKSPTPELGGWKVHYRSRASWISRRRASRACTWCLSASWALVRVLILTCNWKGTQVHQHQHKFVQWDNIYSFDSKSCSSSFCVISLEGQYVADCVTQEQLRTGWSQRYQNPHLAVWTWGLKAVQVQSAHRELSWEIVEKFWDWVYESLIHSLEIASERSTGAGVTFLNRKRHRHSLFYSSAYFWLQIPLGISLTACYTIPHSYHPPLG